MRPIWLAALLAIISCGSAHAADGGISCRSWHGYNDTLKGGLVGGWLMGVQAALFVTSSNDAMELLWPTGHTHRSVMNELNAECKAYPAQTFTQSMVKIVDRLNNPK